MALKKRECSHFKKIVASPIDRRPHFFSAAVRTQKAGDDRRTVGATGVFP